MSSDKKIRVCHIISGDLWAGAEVVTFRLLCELQNNQAIDLSVICLNDKELAKKLQEKNIRVFVIEESRYNFFMLAYNILRQVKKVRPHIIHSHRYKENLLACCIKLCLSPIVLIQTVHGLTEKYAGTKQTKARLYNFLSTFFSKLCFDKIICVSEDIQKQLSYTFSNSQLAIVHNGIDSNTSLSKSAQDVKCSLGISPTDFLFVSVGRLVPIKSFDTIIKAAKLITEKHENVFFAIVGDGPEEKNLKDLTQELQAKDKIIFTGFQIEPLDIINAGDAFILSSLYEGLPISLLEACLLEKPIVASNVGGIKEVLENQVSGLLSPPGDVTSLSSLCSALLKDAALRQSIARKAKEKALEKFTMHRQAQETEAIYSISSATLY